MPFHQPDEVRYYTFETLDDLGLPHAIFTRAGGVSPAPWHSLNLGGTVGDELVRVAENRKRALACVGRTAASVYDVWQVHSADVVVADAPRPAHTPHPKADAIITNTSGVTLLMRFADCVPILLFDPARKAVGLAHAGWKGTLARVAAAAVQAMGEAFGTQPQDVRAAIGPSIAAHHYTVGAEVAALAKQTFGAAATGLLPSQNGAVQFDLWAANRLVLEESGVRHIEIAGHCTVCRPQDWYSHRGEHGKTGRFGALVGL